MSKQPIGLVLQRAFQMRCPSCGKAPIFEKGWKMIDSCPSCRLNIRDREPDTYLFMYVSTAGITGIFLVAMLLFTPTNILLAQAVVIIASSILFIGTIPLRKSIAIALDYLF